MSDFIGIKSFAIANAIYALLNHVEKDGLIDEVVEALDKVSDQNLAGRSEAVQERLVTKVLLPLAEKLMKENHERYVQLLEASQHGYPLGVERRADYHGVSKPRQEAQPGGQNFTVRRSTDHNA